VDDGVRERGSWRNAAIAFVAGLGGELLMLTPIISKGEGSWSQVHWNWQIVASVVVPVVPVVIVAWRIPWRFRWWVGALAPVATPALFFLGATLVYSATRT
jgi:hypothetical protein